MTVADVRSSLLKKKLWHRSFSCEFCESFQNTFFCRTYPGHCFRKYRINYIYFMQLSLTSRSGEAKIKELKPAVCITTNQWRKLNINQGFHAQTWPNSVLNDNAPSHISSDFLRTATLWKKLFPQSSIQLFTRSSHPEMFLKKGFLIICSKFTGEHPCPSVILIKMQSKFIEITLRHGCSRVFL